MKNRSLTVVRAFIATVAVFACQIAAAAQIDELFRDGIFAVPWGTTKGDVEAKFPGGKWSRMGPTAYTVNDARAVFGIERANSRLLFGFDSEGKLSAVRIYFPSDAQTIVKLRVRSAEIFGPSIHDQRDDRSSPQSMGAASFSTRWPIDGQFQVSLIIESIGLSRQAAIAVDRVSPSNRSRAGLGID